MAYVALKKQNGPGGVVRQPGDHMPEADKWPNPKLWVSKGFVRWVEDGEVEDGRWKGFDAFVAAGQGGRALRPAPAGAVKPGFPPPPGGASVRPVAADLPPVRLPLLPEYVAAGYSADGYDAFIRARTARAAADGKRVEVREPTQAEAQEMARLQEAARAAAPRPATPSQATDPMPRPDAAAQEELDRQDVATPPKPPEVPELPARKDLEKLQQPQLLALARARGLKADDDAGKGKLLKLLAG